MPRLSPSLRRLFSREVVAADTHEEGDPAMLHPQELQQVERAVAKRVNEFAAGRACARLALHELGIPAFTLLAAPDRSPIWPPGVVGSISHTAGYCAVVVARRESCLSLGVDCEQIDRVSRDIWSSIASQTELSWCASQPAHGEQVAIALLFSAKEALYKCQYALTSQWLDFHDLIVEVPGVVQTGGTFQIRAQRDLEIGAHVRWPVIGRYRLHDSFVTTAIEIPNRSTAVS